MKVAACLLHKNNYHEHVRRRQRKYRTELESGGSQQARNVNDSDKNWIYFRKKKLTKNWGRSVLQTSCNPQLICRNLWWTHFFFGHAVYIELAVTPRSGEAWWVCETSLCKRLCGGQMNQLKRRNLYCCSDFRQLKSRIRVGYFLNNKVLLFYYF